MNTGDTVLLHSKQEPMQIQAYVSMSVIACVGNSDNKIDDR